jgi:hypothetical protein
MKKTSDNQLDTTRRNALKRGIGAASLAALGTRAAAPVAISTATITITTEKARAEEAPAPRLQKSRLKGIGRHRSYGSGVLIPAPRPANLCGLTVPQPHALP